MVEVLPSFTLVNQSFVTDILGRVTFLLICYLIEDFKPFGGDNTLVVTGEDVWGLELRVEDSISEDLLHHLLLAGEAISTTHIVRSRDLGNWFAILELRAFNTEGLGLVRSARLGNNVTIFSKVRVHMGPSSLATFGQVIAVQEELGRELIHFLSILKFKTRFHHLGERNCVAGST